MAAGKGAVTGPLPVKGKKKNSRPEDFIANKPGESSSMASGKSKMNEDDLATDELMESLKRHDASFTALLSLIPANLYLANDSDSEEGSEISLSVSNTVGKRKSAEALAEERKARIREAKRAKHDPDNQKNAIEIQQERATERAKKLAAREKEDNISLEFSMGHDLLANGVTAGDTDEDDEEEDDDDEEEDEDDGDDIDDGESYETLPTSTKGSEELSDKPAIPSPLPGAGPPSILDLRARLQAKIQGIQAQRRAQVSSHLHNNENGDDESIASTKDELLEERRRQRGEMRDRRRKAAKERKRAEREGTSSTGKKSNLQNAGNDKKGGLSNPSLFVSPVKGAYDKHPSSLATGENGNDIAFSSLQFDEADSGKRSKHALPSDPKAALAILEARKRKDEARKAKIAARTGDEGEGEDFEKERTEHLRWSKAEAAAQGVKIRDDEKLLRKAAKKRDKQKSKSSLEWNKRSRDLASQQAARQKKRTENIAARKDRKNGKGGKTGGSSSSNANSAKSKALGSKRKSGGSRPGFEGKRRPLGGKAGGSGGKKSGGHGKK